MKVIPYLEHNGAWTFSDSFIAGLFDLMCVEKTAKRVFYAGSVHTSAQFVVWLKSKAINAVLVLDDDDKPLCAAWISGIEDRRAWFNFNIFRAAWGGDMAAKVAITARDHWLYMRDIHGRYIFDVLVGLTPENNRLALRMAGLCGAKQLGAIPNFVTNHWTQERHGAVISYMERE